MNCQSCGMPMMTDEDHGGGRVENLYCKNCTDVAGNLKSREEVREGMITFYQQSMGKSREEAEKEVDAHMAMMPAWTGGQTVTQAAPTAPPAPVEPAAPIATESIKPEPPVAPQPTGEVPNVSPAVPEPEPAVLGGPAVTPPPAPASESPPAPPPSTEEPSA